MQTEAAVTIDANHETEVLELLRVHHGISSETVYNDLYGVIQHQTVYRDAYHALYKGVALAEKGEYEQAIQRYRVCIKLNPEMASAYSNRADAYHELGEYDSAIADYRKALTFDTLNSAIYHNLGVAYAAQGNYHQAIQYYSQALHLDDDDYTRYYRFEAWLLLEEWEEARQVAISTEMSWDDISSLLHEHYESISDFEQKKGVCLPDDIVELLGGREVSG